MRLLLQFELKKMEVTLIISNAYSVVHMPENVIVQSMLKNRFYEIIKVQ